MTSVVTIVDYGVGNVASIANMLKKAGFDSQLVSDPDQLSSADKLILPGVGSFDRAAAVLRQTGLRAAIVSRAESGIPILGVCLGMQLLMDGSDEGDASEPGLGLIPGRVRRFPAEVDGSRLLVPHMGWNTVRRKGNSTVLPSVRDGDRYYFVHSYFADPADPSHRVAVSTHGVEFASMTARANVVGAQFHPEKSHRTGMALLTDFAGDR